MVERRVRSRDAAHALPLQPNLDVPLAEFQRPANAVGSQLPLTPVLVEGADRHVQARGGLAHAYQSVAAAEPRCRTGGCQGLFLTSLVLSHGSPLMFRSAWSPWTWCSFRDDQISGRPSGLRPISCFQRCRVVAERSGQTTCGAARVLAGPAARADEPAALCLH